MMNLTLSTIAEKVGKKVIGGTGEEKTVFGRQTTHQEAGQATDSGV